MNFIKNFINTTSIGALIAILVAINIVATFLPFKLDFTANRVFTINKVTKDIAKNLKDEVEIKVYLSETLPSRLLPLKQDLKDTLSLYNRLGKVKITYIDPKQDQKIRQEAYTDGVSPLRLSEVGSTKLEVSEAYFGLVVKSKDKIEPWPVIETGTDLEYEITSRILKVSRDPVNVAVDDNHGEQLGEGVRTLLEKNYKIQTGTDGLASQTAGLKTFLILNPKTQFKDEDFKKLDEYLKNNGNILIAANGVEVDNRLQTATASHQLNNWLANYGVKINSDLVVSASNEIANFNTAAGTFMTPYPYWVKSTDGTVFPWVSSIEIKNKADIKITPIIKTIPQSMTIIDSNFNLDPSAQLPKNNMQEFVLGVEIQPKNTGKIVVIGDADWLEDGMLTRQEGNQILFMNLVDNLAGDVRLASIRGRRLVFLPLTDIPDQSKETIKWINVFTAPLLLGVFGGIRIWKRSKNAL